MNKIKGIVIIWFISSFIELMALTMPNLLLYYQAESFIDNSPQESSIPISNLINKYNELQVKWLGAKNKESNQFILKNNPIFANNAIMLNANESSLTKNESVQFIRLRYTTDIPDGIQNVSGLLLLPPTNTPKGIVLFFHSTITGKLNAPSLRFNDYKAQMLAVVFAANGYIVASPDYIGLGDNLKVMHPYILYPKLNVEDGKSILKATTKYLHTKYPKIIIPHDLFVSGYSEGGSYALWFSRIYQEQLQFKHDIDKLGFKLRKTVPIEGAYNLTKVMFPFLLNNQVREVNNPYKINTSMWGTLLKPSLVANVMVSFAYYNHKEINTLLNPGFYSLNCSYLPQSRCGQADMSRYNLNNYILTQVKNFAMVMNYFFAAIFKESNGFTYSIIFNGVEPLLATGASKNPELLKMAENANIINWKSSNPVTFISLEHDSLVPEQNTSDAYNGMLASGSTNLKYIKVDNNMLKARSLFGSNVIDHVSFEIYAQLIALKEFQITSVSH